MPSLKHIHQYQLFKSRPRYMRCGHPSCSHFVLKELVEGKESLCNECGSLISALTKEQMKRVKPRCINCMETKSALAFQQRKALLENLFAGEEEKV